MPLVSAFKDNSIFVIVFKSRRRISSKYLISNGMEFQITSSPHLLEFLMCGNFLLQITQNEKLEFDWIRNLSATSAKSVILEKDSKNKLKNFKIIN